MSSLQKNLFQKYLSTEGRIGRCDYWLRGAVLTLGWILFGVTTWIFCEVDFHNSQKPYIIFFGLFALWLGISGYISFCLSTQRAHDLGRSAWFGFWGRNRNDPLGFSLALVAGDEGINEYGDQPPEPSQIKIKLTLLVVIANPIILLALFVIQAWDVLSR